MRWFHKDKTHTIRRRLMAVKFQICNKNYYTPCELLCVGELQKPFTAPRNMPISHRSLMRIFGKRIRRGSEQDSTEKKTEREHNVLILNWIFRNRDFLSVCVYPFPIFSASNVKLDHLLFEIVLLGAITTFSTVGNTALSAFPTNFCHFYEEEKYVFGSRKQTRDICCWQSHFQTWCFWLFCVRRCPFVYSQFITFIYSLQMTLVFRKFQYYWD
jgi:Na+/melibiose symporter-like transporter